MITNQFGEQYLYAVNRGMFEQESALERIEREFGKLLEREDSLIIFVGSDSGNIIRYVLGRELPMGARYIFIEPESILNQVASTVDLSSAKDRVWLVTPEQFEDASQEASIKNYMYVDGVHLIRSLSAEYGFFAQYRSEYWDLDSYINDVRWNAQVSLGQDIFIKCQLDNCADNQYPITDIKGCLRDKTVIVLGGGPSLDEHIDWIKRHREQLVVFAVSRISARLLQVDLQPDFVFSVDPQDISYQLSKKMLRFGEDVVFINQYHVAPKLLSQWPHRKYFTGSLLPWTSELNPEETFNGAGPTVTNSAIAAAAWLGSQQILLAGVDLCFTPEGFTHAEGSGERAAGPKTDLSSLVLETNAGSLASTTPDYALASRNIGLQAQALKNSQVRMINLSAGAAKMEGVEYRPPHEVILENVPERVQLPAQNGFYSTKRLNAIKQELTDKSKQADQMLALIQQASNVHTRMYEGDTINPALKQELEDLDERISEEHKDIFRLAKMLSILGLLRMAQSFSDLDDIELKQIKQRLDIYYAALDVGAKRLKQHIESGLASVQVRLQEQSLHDMGSNDVEALTRKWIERGEPGRFFLCTRAQVEADLLDSVKQSYEDEMRSEQLTTFIQQSKLNNLHALPARIRYLKDKADLSALEMLHASLQENEELKPFLPLIKAIIAQLKQQPDIALAELLPVMEQPDSPILEQTLAMMVSLCAELGHHQAVMDAMAGLASLNAFYLDLYSDALMANGQASDAIQHLTEYLQYFPGDRQAVIKLKRWYLEVGSQDGVLLADSLLEAQATDD